MAGRVLVFGTFDGLHTGHLFFLQSAKSFGQSLFVSVARDAHVIEFKQKRPIWSENERLEKIQALPFVDDACLSDATLGVFDVIDQYAPDVIVLGHDQKALSNALQIWMNNHDSNISIEYAPHMGRD